MSSVSWDNPLCLPKKVSIHGAGETISYKISWWWRNFLNWVLKGLLCHQVPIDSKLYSKDCWCFTDTSQQWPLMLSRYGSPSLERLWKWSWTYWASSQLLLLSPSLRKSGYVSFSSSCDGWVFISLKFVQGPLTSYRPPWTSWWVLVPNSFWNKWYIRKTLTYGLLCLNLWHCQICTTYTSVVQVNLPGGPHPRVLDSMGF